MNHQFYSIVEDIHSRDSRYNEGAYEFVMQALSYTQKKFKKAKHVSADELLVGIKELLISTFGPMTLAVLNHWGIRSTEDFGNVVRNLVQDKILCESEDDDFDHFKDGFDFQKVFKDDYQEKLMKKVRKMR
jgi:uncharacterized repeat protein (TIGR04138 family)